MNKIIKHLRRQKGFNLIEMLTVVFILASLVNLMIPNVRMALYKSKLTACQSNLRNLATAIRLYHTDYEEYPQDTEILTPSYLSTIPTCPSVGKDTYTQGYESEGQNYTIFCRGRNHSEVGLTQDQPYYNDTRGLGP